MKKALLFALALLLPACEQESPSMTFGLDFRVRKNDLPFAQTSDWCLPPGAGDGNTSASSIDYWEIGGQPPHLFLETYPDAEQNVYRVQVYSALEREKDGIWWEPSEVLAERSYDSAFGEGGGVDSFVVEFQGEPYTIQAQGLPPSTTCL
jgi:hypothetical protein